MQFVFGDGNYPRLLCLLHDLRREELDAATQRRAAFHGGCLQRRYVATKNVIYLMSGYDDRSTVKAMFTVIWSGAASD